MIDTNMNSEPVVGSKIAGDPVGDDNLSDNDTPNGESGSCGDNQDVAVNYVMAKGRSLCGTFKGIISEGQPIEPRFLRDADEGFQRWKDAGFIVTDAEYKSQVEAAKK